MYQALVAAARAQGTMAPSASAEVLVRDDELRVDLHLDAEAGAVRAGAVRAVEAEVARRQLAEGEAAVGAGEVLRVEALVLALDGRRSMTPPPSFSAVSTESARRLVEVACCPRLVLVGSALGAGGLR